MNYASRSTAYEVAVAQAEGDLRQGRDVVIEVLCDDESAGENGGPEPRAVTDCPASRTQCPLFLGDSV